MVDLRAPKPESPTGVPKVVTAPREGSPIDFLSPNWCDCTTWWGSSTRHEDQSMTDSGDGLTWTSGVPHWIDVTHGKITQEHNLHASYGPVVKVDGVTMTEHSPGTTDGNYSIDHTAGTITFTNSQAGKTVTATFSEMQNSTWAIKPDVGKKLRLIAVEVQFTTDIELTDTVVFQFYGYVDAFAPHLLTTADPPGPFPPLTKIPIGSPRKYLTMMDFINESQRSFPEIPALGGSGWRGLQTPVHIFRWPYEEGAVRDLFSSAGMEVQISLEGHTEFGGSKAYVTLYAMLESEQT